MLGMPPEPDTRAEDGLFAPTNPKVPTPITLIAVSDRWDFRAYRIKPKTKIKIEISSEFEMERAEHTKVIASPIGDRECLLYFFRAARREPYDAVETRIRRKSRSIPDCIRNFDFSFSQVVRRFQSSD